MTPENKNPSPKNNNILKEAVKRLYTSGSVKNIKAGKKKQLKRLGSMRRMDSIPVIGGSSKLSKKKKRKNKVKKGKKSSNKKKVKRVAKRKYSHKKRNKKK